MEDSNSNFGVVDIILKKKKNDPNWLCVRGSITCSVTVHLHVLWLVFTHVLIRCRHTKTYTVQTHHASIPTVVVSLLVHDNMYVYIYIYIYVCVHVHVHVQGLPLK